MKKNIALKNLTTMAVGGKARYFVAAKNLTRLKSALRLASKNKWPVFILGGGSNVVFPDAGFAGLVIKIDLRGKKFTRRGNAVLAEAAAGENWDEFVKTCARRNLAGVECLSGIPGLVGGTPIQNVGAYGQEVAQTVVSVKCLDRKTLRLVEFKNKDCGFGYRASRFKTRDRGKYIVLSVIFRLVPNGKPILKYSELARQFKKAPSLAQVRRAVLALRRKKSMLFDRRDPNARSCGSFFVNPVVNQAQFKKLQSRFPQISNFPAGRKIKISAAWLVENAGFYKGYKYKGVGISEHHSLAIINRGQGTAREITELAVKIKKAVKKKFGIVLAPEPNIIQAFPLPSRERVG